MLNRGLDKLELLRIVEAVANEKSIDKELVIGSMESAIQKAALIKFGNDNDIEVIIDRESGDIKIQKVLNIVQTVEDPAREITLEDAQKDYPKNKNLKICFRDQLTFNQVLLSEGKFKASNPISPLFYPLTTKVNNRYRHRFF